MLRLVVLSCALLAAIGCGSDGGVELNEEALMEPTSDEMKTEAPEQYAVTFETTAGNFVLTVYRDWAPRGADRFYNLVTNGFYNEQRFFRVVPGFVVQWGMSGDPEITKESYTYLSRDDQGRALYATHHFSEDELKKLLLDTGFADIKIDKKREVSSRRSCQSAYFYYCCCRKPFVAY